MNQTPDDDLHRLFDEARRKDEGEAPPFRRVLSRARAPRSSGFRWGARALAAAGAAVVAVAFIRGFHRSPEIPPERIESWKPPTDFLLEGTFTGLLDTTPALPESIPDYSPLLAKEKGIRS